MECYEKSLKTQILMKIYNFTEGYIITQFIQENSYAHICEYVCKYTEIHCKNAYQTANLTYLWVE